MDRWEGKRRAWPLRKSRPAMAIERKQIARQSGERKIHPLSPLWFIGRQCLPHIRLGNPELSRNPCWRNARLEGRANGIHLTTGQWDFGNIHGASFGNPPLGQIQQGTRRLLRIRPNTRRESASPFHLLKCCCVEQIQLSV